jgi:hypothetical protein
METMKCQRGAQALNNWMGALLEECILVALR